MKNVELNKWISLMYSSEVEETGEKKIEARKCNLPNKSVNWLIQSEMILNLNSNFIEKKNSQNSVRMKNEGKKNLKVNLIIMEIFFFPSFLSWNWKEIVSCCSFQLEIP